MNARSWSIASGAALLLAGCAAVPNGGQSTAPSTPSSPMRAEGLEDVLGQDARALTRLFGQPVQDMREFSGRRLQFTNGRCVLDAYLYARREGQEAVVTHVDARLPDGRDTDRAGCAATLKRR
ncbi:hypothetical protein [Sphingomonas sp. C3-2]|uniref:hypothetical protein n=1 Tax=Sphingomonas sp. C3-2 TaxID=3062169 RepID=UPI00294B7AB4|nr:hypothetical protein [Sphingomonas sp. C3-2]WOK38077.1 hypothetical protein QYC26_07830 [Sphingomonas sp. C3-2]